MAKATLNDFRIIGENREFRLGIGIHRGKKIAICSTGIGGPSTEIAVVELSRLGVQTFIRVGGMGAIPSEIQPGSITSVAYVLREGGAASFYDAGTDPLPAHASVLDALGAAARQYDESLTPVTVLSCDSYYVGEGRPLDGLEGLAEQRYAAIVAKRPDAMDMECETIFAVGKALGCRYGALLAAHGNRTTDDWLEDYEPVQQRMLKIACAAATTFS
ncbi:hypothetical protein GCM10027562_25020 [Arthrobacter pigmenti]